VILRGFPQCLSRFALRLNGGPPGTFARLEPGREDALVGPQKQAKRAIWRIYDYLIPAAARVNWAYFDSKHQESMLEFHEQQKD